MQSRTVLWRRGANGPLAMLVFVSVIACESPRIADPAALEQHHDVASAVGGAGGIQVVNVSNDTTSQNETPLAVNPRNPLNMLTGNNDWNWNNGCGFNVTFDGGKTWTKTLSDGFIPAITKYTNDPSIAGTGYYDYGGDPAVAYGPDGTAYFPCFGYQAAPPYGVVLLMNRSSDGGRTWLEDPTQVAVVSAFKGNGQAKGSNGQFPDHEAIHVANDGTIYVTWAQFSGYGLHSPVLVASSVDGGRTFGPPVKVTAGGVVSDQDARITSDPKTGTAYLTFDNYEQGKGNGWMYVSTSKDRGRSWSAPVRIALFQNPVCVFPPYCFNIGGNAFRGPGSYPVPGVDPTRDRLYVAYTDIISGRAQVLLTYASTADVTKWSAPQVVAPGAGDRINVEMSIEPSSGRIDLMANDRSWTNNALFDITYFGSRDGGATWNVRRVTKQGWDPSQYGVPSSSSETGIRPFIGDYDGIISLPAMVGMTWTGPGKTYGVYPTNLEVYFASLTP